MIWGEGGLCAPWISSIESAGGLLDIWSTIHKEFWDGSILSAHQSWGPGHLIADPNWVHKASMEEMGRMHSDFTQYKDVPMDR